MAHSPLHEVSPGYLEALLRDAGTREVLRGEILVRQGAPSDALYFVLYGRFGVYVDDATEPVGEIGQGQPLGEIGFFAGLPRTATVKALRDSRILALTRERFQEINQSSPEIGQAIIAALARRLAGLVSPKPRAPTPVRTLAVVWAGDTRISPPFIDALRRVFGSASRALFLDEHEVASRFPGALDDAVVSSWLNSLESDYEFVLYLAGERLSGWTKRCIRQADAVLLVASADAASTPNPSELFAFSVHPRSARRLVILHKARTQTATDSRRWLGPRDVFMHHHVALPDLADVARLFRFISGRALGFVASGGGALGSAHLGVYKAFRDAGATFDILGGTSVGAAMAAGLAYDVDPERVDEGTYNIFVASRAFRRPTFPRYALLDHKAFDRALKAEYRDVRIEDLWRPYFALSTDLSERKIRIHREGLVWQAVRASGSIPAVLPPFFTSDGAMLVDGGLIDNVPLAPMKALKSGPNVVVALGFPAPKRHAVDYDAIPGAAQLIGAMLNPFAWRRLPKIPGIFQVIMLSMLANRREPVALGDADIAITPSAPPDVRFTSWERHRDTFRHSYRETSAWIEQKVREGDTKVLSVIQPDR